jgi:DNA invertase Pin-like site-specific DNA recombinase
LEVSLSSIRFHSPVVGYASLALGQSGFDSLYEFCQEMPFPTDLLAEDSSPSATHRPMWNEVLDLIEQKAVTTLVVPSLLHIAEGDARVLSIFLHLLRKYGVTLKSLEERIDSRRDSKAEILAHLKRASPKREVAYERQ